VQLVKQELFIAPDHVSSPLVFSGVRVTRSLVWCICFVDRCLSFFFWPLCCLSFFELGILITLLVSSYSSYQVKTEIVTAKEPNMQSRYLTRCLVIRDKQSCYLTRCLVIRDQQSCYLTRCLVIRDKQSCYVTRCLVIRDKQSC
jgi:hypothetical protein